MSDNDPAKRTYRSLHLRVRSDVADRLNSIAARDTERTERRIYVAELHRIAVRDYIAKRLSEDESLAQMLAVV